MSYTQRQEGIEPGKPHMKWYPLVGRNDRNSKDVSQRRHSRRPRWCSSQKLAVLQEWIEHDRRSSLGYNLAVSLNTGEGSAGGIH
jgi:hypothetical protein